METPTDLRKSFDDAKDWSKQETGNFRGVVAFLKSEEPRQVLHGCFALSQLLDQRVDEAPECILEAVSTVLERHASVPLICGSLIKVMAQMAQWSNAKKQQGKDKVANRCFQKIYAIVDSNPKNEIVAFEFSQAMNTLFSGHSGFKNQIQKVTEYLFGNALHTSERVRQTATSALCRVTWSTADLTDILVQRGVKEFVELLDGPWIPYRNARLVGLVNMIRYLLIHGGHDKTELQARVAAGPKVTCEEGDAVIKIPFKALCGLVDTVFNKILHSDESNIHVAPGQDVALGEVYRIILIFLPTLLETVGRTINFQPTWVTNLILTLSTTPTDVQVYYATEAALVIRTIITLAPGLIAGATQRKILEYIKKTIDAASTLAAKREQKEQEIETENMNAQLDFSINPKKRKRNKKKMYALQSKNTEEMTSLETIRQAFGAAISIWNGLVQSSCWRNVQPTTAAEIFEVIARTLWNGHTLLKNKRGKATLDHFFCNDTATLDHLLDAMIHACELVPDMRQIAYGLTRLTGSIGNKIHDRLWSVIAVQSSTEAPQKEYCLGAGRPVHGNQFSAAFNTALKHILDNLANESNVPAPTPSGSSSALPEKIPLDEDDLSDSEQSHKKKRRTTKKKKILKEDELSDEDDAVRERRRKRRRRRRRYTSSSSSETEDERPSRRKRKKDEDPVPQSTVPEPESTQNVETSQTVLTSNDPVPKELTMAETLAASFTQHMPVVETIAPIAAAIFEKITPTISTPETKNETEVDEETVHNEPLDQPTESLKNDTKNEPSTLESEVNEEIGSQKEAEGQSQKEEEAPGTETNDVKLNNDKQEGNVNTSIIKLKESIPSEENKTFEAIMAEEMKLDGKIDDIVNKDSQSMSDDDDDDENSNCDLPPLYLNSPQRE